MLTSDDIPFDPPYYFLDDDTHVTEAGPEEWLSLLVLKEHKDYIGLVKSLRDSYTTHQSFSIKQVLLVLWRLKSRDIPRISCQSSASVRVKSRLRGKWLPNSFFGSAAFMIASKASCLLLHLLM